MKKNPLALFTGLALAALAALVVVEKDKWMGSPVAVAKVEPAPVAEAPKVEELAKVAEPVEAKKAMPSFDTVRVEAGGETIVAGQAEPGSEVTIKYNGANIGTAVANADGAFVVTPEKPLPKGPGALSIEMKSKDVVVSSADTVAVDVKEGVESTPMVAVLKPDQPTTVIQLPAASKPALPPMNTVNLDSVDYDEQGNIVFSGRGPSGSKVQIYVDNGAYGLAAIGADGTWTMPGGVPLTIGAHELRADEIGADGTVTSRVAMPFYREDPTKVAKAAPVPEKPAVVAAAEPAPVVATTGDKTAQAIATAPAATTTTTTEVAKTPDVAAVVPAPVVAPAAAPVVEPAPAIAAATPPVVEPPKVEAAPAPVAVAEAKAPAQIIIQPGNNLWKLSRKIYGKGMMYTVIYEANKGQIRKPGLIYPGQVLMTPDAAKTP
jgi:nucleoid-associated protein YgaU